MFSPIQQPAGDSRRPTTPAEVSLMPFKTVYIVAARRSAIGRIGGTHRRRRLPDLAAPVVSAALADAAIAASEVDEILLGNATEGSNPARLVALASGLPEQTSAMTIDRQCASGLEAVLAAVRAIALGERSVIVAGGAESLSTAPWRIARPRSPYQLPQFIGTGPDSGHTDSDVAQFEASDRLAQKIGIGRPAQDQWALASFRKAATAREAGRFLSEIVPIRTNAEEMRDESAIDADIEEIESQPAFNPPDGTATAGNTSALHDGAAFCVAVAQPVWDRLGRPPALRLVASQATGVRSGDEASAPLIALEQLLKQTQGIGRADIGAIEMSERSAVEAIHLEKGLELADGVLNADGGAISRGHPLGAASAVALVRLYSRMLRTKDATPPRLGAVTLGALGGLGIAALFERADGS